jgi:hypothetical protein
MSEPSIVCPRCARVRVAYDGYVCKCGQRFRVARAGSIRFVPESDVDSLFWVPGAQRFLDIDGILALPELQGVDPTATAIELPVARLEAAAELAASTSNVPRRPASLKYRTGVDADPDEQTLHTELWRMREMERLRWSEISARLGIDEPRLARMRLAAIKSGRAVKEPNGRVRWLAPSSGGALERSTPRR